MSADLFSEFKSSDKESWKKQIEKELKEKFNRDKLWKVANSVYTESYYTAAEVDIASTEALHHAQRKTTGWLNMPLIKFSTPSLTNAKMRTALNGGADAILLDLRELSLPKCELIKTLHSIKLSDSPLYFVSRENPSVLYNEISKGAGYYLKGGIANDPVTSWIQGGRQVGEALDDIALVLQQTKAMKDFRPFMIESHTYHDAGADPVQELAFMISSMVKCVDQLTDTGISPLHALNRFFFSVSVGPEYLTELAKLRALRLLYRKVTRAYQLPDALSNAFIHVQTSSLYNAVTMPHTNMIRSTSEAMSAVAGGCDALTVQSYIQPPDDLAERIAGNVSLVISNESYLSEVADPASGSFLIDKVSLLLADSAWALFIKMEDNGGMIGCFQNGFIQSEIEKSWHEKTGNLFHHKVMVGVNKYNAEENTIPATSQKTTRPTALIKRNLSEALLAQTHT